MCQNIYLYIDIYDMHLWITHTIYILRVGCYFILRYGSHIWYKNNKLHQMRPHTLLSSSIWKKKVIFNPPYVLTIAHYNIFPAEKASFSVHKSCPTCSVVVFMLQYPYGGLLESIWYHMRWCGVTTFDLWPLNPLFGGHFGSICWFCLIFLSKKWRVYRALTSI